MSEGNFQARKYAPGLVLTIAVVLALAACSGETGKVVKWDELRKLDELAEKAEAASGGAGDIPALRKLAAQAETEANKLGAMKPPAHVANRERVAQLQADLSSLAAALEPRAKMTDAELKTALEGLHPIVEQLMEASGMPHVHEHPEGSPGNEGTANGGK